MIISERNLTEFYMRPSDASVAASVHLEFREIDPSHLDEDNMNNIGLDGYDGETIFAHKNISARKAMEMVSHYLQNGWVIAYCAPQYVEVPNQQREEDTVQLQDIAVVNCAII